MLKVIQFFQGKKSYLSGIALFVIGGLFFLGILTQDQANALAIMLGGTSILALKSAVKKAEN